MLAGTLELVAGMRYIFALHPGPSTTLDLFITPRGI